MYDLLVLKQASAINKLPSSTCVGTALTNGVFWIPFICYISHAQQDNKLEGELHRGRVRALNTYQWWQTSLQNKLFHAVARELYHAYQ